MARRVKIILAMSVLRLTFRRKLGLDAIVHTSSDVWRVPLIAAFRLNADDENAIARDSGVLPIQVL